MHNRDYVALYRREFAKAVRLVDKTLLTLPSEAAKPGLSALVQVTMALINEGLDYGHTKRKWDDIFQRINNPSLTRALFDRVWNDVQELRTTGRAAAIDQIRAN